jgi:hypothetical protein
MYSANLPSSVGIVTGASSRSTWFPLLFHIVWKLSYLVPAPLPRDQFVGSDDIGAFQKRVARATFVADRLDVQGLAVNVQLIVDLELPLAYLEFEDIKR